MIGYCEEACTRADWQLDVCTSCRDNYRNPPLAPSPQPLISSGFDQASGSLRSSLSLARHGGGSFFLFTLGPGGAGSLGIFIGRFRQMPYIQLSVFNTGNPSYRHTFLTYSIRAWIWLIATSRWCRRSCRLQCSISRITNLLQRFESFHSSPPSSKYRNKSLGKMGTINLGTCNYV